MIITISGLYGSGGFELAQDLAKKFGYRVYDNDIIEESVKQSGLDMHRSTLTFYDEHDAGIDKNFEDSDKYKNALLELEMDVLPMHDDDEIGEPFIEQSVKPMSGVLAAYLNTAPINRFRGTYVSRKQDIDALRYTQGKVILDAAEKGNAIFLGRCASHILKRRKDTLNIYTLAELDTCKKRIGEHYGINDEVQVEKLIKTTNRRRSYYYATFTGGEDWYNMKNYDISIFTDYLGYEGTLEYLAKLVEAKAAQLGE